LDSHSKLTVAGHTHAVKWWRNLHSVGHPIPQAMRCFDRTMSESFANLWAAAFPLGANKLDETIKRDWHSPAVVLATRKVFDDFGKHLAKFTKQSEVYRRFSTASRIYSRLPTWQGSWADEPLPPDVNSADTFYPGAALPCEKVIAHWAKMADSMGKTVGPAIELVRVQLLIKLRRTTNRVRPNRSNIF
jgi:hypothetical protein